MERKFIIASHGQLASGVQSSLELIIGNTGHLTTVNAYTDGNEDIAPALDAALNALQPAQDLIIFTDLLGGSITNQVLRHALRERVHVVAGFNLALLIEILMADPDTPAAEVITAALANAREQMVYVNKLIPSHD